MTGVAATLLICPLTLSATDYELIAADSSFETKLCINSAAGPINRLSNHLKTMRLTRNKLSKVLACNDMDVHSFVSAYGTPRMKSYFHLIDTDVRIKDIARQSDKKIQLVVSSSLAK